MSTRKRTDPGMDSGNIVDGPRKRHKDASSSNHTQPASKSPSPPAPPPRKLTLKLKKEPEASTSGSKNAEVAEMGTKIWNLIRHAKDSSGRVMSYDFLKLPSKKLYPDYYMFIKQPISLDEIKAKLEKASYPSIQAVKADFDLLFTNAKSYNLQESIIWADADTMHRMALTEYSALTGEQVDIPVQPSALPPAEAREDGAGSKNSKSRPPSLQKLLKTRLQKLYKKKDANGLEVVTAFVELPSKRDWPMYYKTIKKPISLDMIEKKIDRKEYDTAQTFVNDVELMFSNAFTFNEEDSPVWIHAKILQEAFRSLMEDMPSPYNTSNFPSLLQPHPAQPAPAKIKLKVPQAAVKAEPPAPKPEPVAKPEPEKKPAPPPKPTAAPTAPAPTPAAPARTTSTPKLAPTAAPPAQATVPPPQAPASVPPTSAVSQYTPNQYAPFQASYPYYNTPQQAHPNYPQQMHPAQPLAATSQAPASAQTPIVVPPMSTPAAPANPAVQKPLPTKHIKGLTLRTTPAGRRVRFESIEELDLRFWSLRLGGGETGVEIVDLEIYDRPLLPAGHKERPERPRTRSAKGKGKADDAMDTDDDDQENHEGERPANGHAEPEVEVKINGAPVRALSLTPPVASPVETNGVLANGNGHPEGHDESGSEDDDEESRKPKRRGRPPKKKGRKGTKHESSERGKAHPLLQRWDMPLNLGNNVVDVHMPRESPETWKIFVERVI